MTLTRLFKTAAMLGLPLILSGCIVGMRFYSSDPRPPKDVALIYAAACSLDAVTPEGRPKMNLVGTNGAISEVLPGKYGHCEEAFRPTKQSPLSSYGKTFPFP
jgi:hypothetical protein